MTKKPTPDLLTTLKRGPGRPRQTPSKTAEQIAASIETEAKKMLAVAQTLRGAKK